MPLSAKDTPNNNCGDFQIFTPDRLGFNMAWLTLGYLAIQLISIPFSAVSKGQFVAVIDGMASLIPLAIALVVLSSSTNLGDCRRRAARNSSMPRCRRSHGAEFAFG